ncbi:hypothetical protein WA026_005465 [Henosepilachna vigintioctopunctata]|uniref:G-protein coupled receptors family 2 profile 2 domain-containing protein n=1 Tax=Henosepilachna vigintioctopunctata TaxID=420089 RepID=A0AAW1TV23_9CUCU
MLCSLECTSRMLSEYFSLFILVGCVSICEILTVLTSVEARKFCPNEYSLVNNSDQRAFWTDFHNLESPILFSTPRCLNEHGQSIKRVCFNGTWLPQDAPVCHGISSNQYCPDNFFEHGDFCMVAYDQGVARSFIQQYQKSNLGNTRNITICDGRRMNEWKKVGIHGHQTSQNCTTTSFAFLPHDHRFHSCPDNCIASELGSNICFCKVVGPSQQKLAIVNSIAQKKIMARLAGKDLCEVQGIKVIDNYTTVITSNYYGLTSKIPNCLIVERHYNSSGIEPPAMVLTFDDEKRKLTLVIENYRFISPSPYFAVNCYTNAGTDPIRYVNKHRINRNDKDYSVYELRLERYIGEYWCEGYSLNLTKVTSNTALAYREKNGNEYSLRVKISDIPSYLSSSTPNEAFDLQEKISSDIRNILRVEVRFMKYFILNAMKVDVLLHLTTYEKNDISEEYEDLSNRLKSLPEDFNVLKFNPVEYCLPDDVSTDESGEVLHWDVTRIHETKIPDRLCFQDNKVPVMRTCKGGFFSGAYWSELNGVCSNDVEIPELTKFLHENLYSNISLEFVNNMTSIASLDSLTYVDIYLYTELMKRVEGRQEDVENIFKIINKLSEKKDTELELSQTIFNATDNLLLILDNKSTVKNLQDNETYIYVDKNILIESVNPFVTNISGLYLSGKSNGALNEMKMVSLKRNETLEEVLQDVDDLCLAVNVPETILQGIEADFVNLSNIRIVFTVFYNDSLFVDSEGDAVGKVVSVVIPGYGTYLNEPIPIVMRSEIETRGVCGYWNLGQKTQRRRGQWSSFGGKYTGNFLNSSNLHLCHFSHLTHFALLIVSESIRIEEGDQEIVDFLIADDTSFGLTVLTIVGTTLSVIGILGIYLTAVLFKQWREKDGTRILLNLSTAIMFEILLLHFAGLNGFYSDYKCLLVGCLLHYALLSKFCWMLIYAFLQYRRFVKVFGAAPKCLILKSVLFGWAFSAIPVVLSLIISPQSYFKSTICYVHGWPLYFGVIFPVFMVTVANLIIFIFVMYNVMTKKVESSIETKFSVLQLYLAILLFFVLGIPWLLAILAEFVTQTTFKTVLMYLFCATGTLQGFILFVFYVLFNEETRLKWRRFIFNGVR